MITTLSASLAAIVMSIGVREHFSDLLAIIAVLGTLVAASRVYADRRRKAQACPKSPALDA